jgi:glycosyltransferase involved in cell wall biosynthesis
MSVSKLSEELAKAGCEIEVFTTTANGTNELPVKAGEVQYIDGVKVTYFKRLTGDHTHYSPDLLAAMRRQAKDFDVVHIHAWWNMVSLLACRIALNRQIPVIVSPRGTLSDYSFNNKNSLAKKMIHTLLGKSLLSRSHLHVTSEQEMRAMEVLLTPRQIFNIPNFINLPDQLTQLSQDKSGPFRLIFLSRIDEKKGLELLFDALKDIKIDYRLTIAGSGDEGYVEALKTLAKKNGIDPFVDWIGFRTADKFDTLQRHDLFLLPSYDENFGNSVIESLSVGTAVLVSKQVGLSPYVENNRLGWVCNHNAHALREHILTAAENRDDLQRIRKVAPEIIRRDYQAATLANTYIAAYKKILANG